MKISRFAAIDVGSNSVRILFMNAVEDSGEVEFKKSELIRVPLRLGDDVFSTRYIRESKVDKLVHCMKAFRHLILANEVISYRAVGTAAMREARNGQEVIDRIREESGISLEIISPEEEARIIYSYQIKDLIIRQRDYIYVDVGGGDTVITLLSKNQPVTTKSFEIGTVRLLLDQVTSSQMDEMKAWLEEQASALNKPEIIATGGEINRLVKFTGRAKDRPISFKELQSLHRNISLYSIEDRIRLLGFNPDRADVIVHATQIYLSLMTWSGITTLWVPQIGIADGLVHQLYEDFRSHSIF